MTSLSKKYSLLSLLVVFSAAFAAFFDVSIARAQQNNPFEVAAEGLTLSPPSFEMTLKPGEETAYTIQVTNPTKNLIELYPSAGNFTASGDDGQPKYEIGTTAIENTSAFSIASWIAFYTPKVALLPEQVVDFKFRIKVPDNAEPGGHYGIDFLGTKPPEEKDQKSQVALSSMVGSLLLVRVPGDIREESRIEEFSAPWFFFSPPVNFNIFLRNTGNIHIRPQGEVTITDWRGQSVDRMDINTKKGSVLPESRRNFDVSWTPEIAPFWKIPIGKFHATLKATYGQNGKTLSQEISFWVIPKWLIITLSVLLFFIVSLVIFLFIRKKRRNRRAARTAEFPRNPHRPVFRSQQTSPPTPTTASFGTPFPPQITPPQRKPLSPTPVTRMTAPQQHPPQRTSDTLPSPRPEISQEWLGRITESNEREQSTKKRLRF